jgi:hypothetical protein
VWWGVGAQILGNESRRLEGSNSSPLINPALYVIACRQRS